MKKIKKFSYDIWIKLVLFRIWFFKNIITFAYIALVVLITLTLCGVFPEYIPLLGQIGELFHFENKNLHGVLSALITITSILVAVYVIATRIQKIGLSDIKSRKIKIMMATAGLRFNESGKIIKIKNATSDIESTPVVSVIQEASTILTASTDFANAQDVDNGSDSLEMKIVENTENKEELTEELEEDVAMKSSNPFVKLFKKIVGRFTNMIHRIFKKKSEERAEKQAQLLESLSSKVDEEVDKIESVVEETIIAPSDKPESQSEQKVVDAVKKDTSNTESTSKQKSAFNAFMRGK